MDDAAALTDRVRTSCAALTSEAQFVTLDHDRLATLAQELTPSLAPTASTALGPAPPLAPHRPAAEVERAALLTLALDAINFGSGYHDLVRKRSGLSGARTMAAALTDYEQWTGALTAERLQMITAVDCSQIFGQELDGDALEELMLRFSIGLNDLGAHIADAGSALELIDDANGSAESFAESLAAMPYYRDTDRYHSAAGWQPVAFYKRAQISAADLARRVPEVRFHDLHRLTAFADNLVPHVLRIDGVLRFDPALEAHIDARLRLDSGSREELEIRAAGVHAVELLAAGTGAPAMHLDLLLWERGSGPHYKAVPRHRARSVFY